MSRLIFHNPNFKPLNIVIETDHESMPLIMEWYGAFFSGDKYMVTFEGRNIPMDINGCPLNGDTNAKS